MASGRVTTPAEITTDVVRTAVPSAGEPRTVVAAVDLGSNSVHLLVAAVARHELEALVDESVFLGLGTGATFAWVAQLAPPAKVGTVTGIVGAAGGLGGYFPPLVMGATYDEQDHSYTIGLILLSLTAVVTLAYTVFGIKKKQTTAA